MNYGDTRSLATGYDRRLRPTKWDVPGVLGYKYYYDDFDEHTGRVTFAQHITGSDPSLHRSQTASSLDRSYEYDHVGRLSISHAGNEARAHAWTGQWTTPDGHYSQGYDYDVWGNVTHRYGWGGEVQGGSYTSSTNLYYSYASGANGVRNNRRAGFSYDNAGNLTFDGGQQFTYDAQGNQVAVDWMSIAQGYDGDGRRVRRTADNTNPARYLRSSVLGGQVVAEINYVNNTSWQFVRGYVYGGTGLLAVQQAGAVSFVHEDPVTKAKRVTNTSGNVVSAVEFDPFGAEAGGSNTAFQPRKFTTYERDPNGTDEAMFRRYNRWHSRFDQPDPFDGSFDLSAPQSFNRYAYVQNDPVNFIDPTGLLPCYDAWCGGGGISWGGGYLGGNGWGSDPRPGRRIIAEGEARINRWMTQHLNVDEAYIPALPFALQEYYVPNAPCETMARHAQRAADSALQRAGDDLSEAVELFDEMFNQMWYVGERVTDIHVANKLRDNNFAGRGLAQGYFGQSDFRDEFKESDDNGNLAPGFHDQTHHFATFLSAGINAWSVGALRFGQWVHRNLDNAGDNRLGQAGFSLGRSLSRDPTGLRTIGDTIRNTICSPR